MRSESPRMVGIVARGVARAGVILLVGAAAVLLVGWVIVRVVLAPEDPRLDVENVSGGEIVVSSHQMPETAVGAGETSRMGVGGLGQDGCVESTIEAVSVDGAALSTLPAGFCWGGTMTWTVDADPDAL